MATSAKAWVRKERANGVALSALQVDLRSQQSSLDSNLVEAVQKELPSLVGISKSVGSTEDRLRQLCKELEVHRVAAAEYASGLHGRLREVELTFDERASLLQRSDEVNLLRRLAEALLNLESLLAPASSKPAATSAASSVDAMEATSRRLLRASGECGRLLLLRHRSQDLPAALRHAARMDHARQTLIEQLCAALGEVLGSSSSSSNNNDSSSSSPKTTSSAASRRSAVRGLLRAFREASAETELTLWVRAEWVSPRLLPMLERAASGREATLASLAEVLLDFVRSDAFAPLAAADAEAADGAANGATYSSISSSSSSSSPSSNTDASWGAPLHLVCEGPWTEWTRYVGEQQAHLFGAGLPDTFHAAYVALQSTLSALDACLPTAAMAAHLRTHTSTLATMRRFNLPIYFQLRLQQTTTPLEAALEGSAAAVRLSTRPGLTKAAAASSDPSAASSTATALVAAHPPPPPTLVTRPAQALVAALRRTLSPEVFLRPLASRLLRLLLQCLARFALWLDSMLVVDAASKPGAPPAPSSSATAADEAPGEESAGCQLIGALAEAAGATTLLLDLLRVLAWLRGELRPRLIALLHLPSRGPADDAPAEGGEAGEGDELAADCLAAYDEGVASLQTRVRLLRASLVARQANECSALLAPTRAIAASYRMTGKPPPSSPSFFVAQALQPLRNFLEAAAAAPAVEATHHAPHEAGGETDGEDGGEAVSCVVGSLAPDERAAWAHSVCAHVTSTYHELAASTLEMVRRDELARQRLSIKRDAGPADGGAGGAAAADGGGGSGGVMSDAHKICVQLCLDVQAYAEELAKVGVDAASLGSYAALQEAVRPEEALILQEGGL